ncbi:MAG TPA: hypothetical protein VM053_06200 [Gemmatimonadaceae bacterium]|nr:hypothetical protein [Gemmatimonadaceae bacterium]
MKFLSYSRLKESVIVMAAAALLVVAVACGREPTDPSSTSISGQWKSFDQDLYIRNIRLSLLEPSPGVVTGKWTADGRTDNFCAPAVPCRDSSVVSGRNEVSQVVLELLGAGTFVGELATQDTLRGIIRSSGTNYHVTFAR